MVPRVGQRIGPYEILGRLGSGGMGLVFSAWDARLQRDVAIKLLREEYATPTMRSRFLQEARAASGLNHPNICTVFDIGEVSGDPFLVMELLKGETLRARLTQRGKLSPEDIRCLASEVLDALGLAHARGVIHRDIKPANIILVNKPAGGFQAKVLDFGLAKVELSDEENTRFDLTTIGTTVGTVSYMSPEQARGEAIDARSDLFSLGSVLYEAATGELPFQGATSALIFVELLGKAPQPVRQQNPAISKDLDRFITKMLAKSPDDRFQSAAAALEALQTAMQRRSPLAGISLWGKGGSIKARPEQPATTAPTSTGPDISPRASNSPSDASTIPPNPANRLQSEAGTVIRPARRTADPFAQRPENSPPPPPAPLPAFDESPRFETPPLGTKQAPPATRAVILRPAKLDPTRSAPPSGERAPGSSAESRLGTPPTQRPANAPASGDLPLATTQSLSAARPSIPSDTPTPAPPTDARAVAESIATPAPTSIPAAAGTANSPPARRSPQHAWRVPALVLLLLGAGLTCYFIYQRQPVAEERPVTAVLADMQNSTGDSALSGVLVNGLQFAFAQSPHLSVRSNEDYLSAVRIVTHGATGEVSPEQARRAAVVAGAGVLVFGDIHKEGTAFVISLHTNDVKTGGRTSEFSETSSSREQIPDALDRLASDLRSGLGESNDSISRTAFPLSKEASSNIDAIESFASGASLQASGNAGEAILAFERAVGLDPHFPQAWLRLADLYREQHAEVAAARAATQAQTNSANASPRTQWLAEASYAINAAGDYGRATEPLNRLLAVYPADLDALNDFALADLLGGKFSDAQVTADRVLQLFRYDSQATEVEELALIAQDRPQAVGSVETLAQAAGLAHPGILALAAAASAANTQMLLPGADPIIPPAISAGLLDAAGHFSEASARWQDMTDEARSTPELLSAAAYADGVSALHRALAADCATALPLAQTSQSLPSGALATFSAGEAEALCGDTAGASRSLAALSSAYTQGSAAQAYLIPDLAATIAWKGGDAPGALRTLDAARQFDPLSLTAYLRGLVEISAKQPQLSIVQFQAMLSHRGPTTLFNPEVYPLAELGLGRAYAASGDTANSSAAYGRFLDLWSSADPSVGAVTEARAHAHL